MITEVVCQGIREGSGGDGNGDGGVSMGGWERDLNFNGDRDTDVPESTRKGVVDVVVLWR